QIDDLVALEPGVQLRELGERASRRAQDERHEALEIEVGEVALLDERDRSHLAVRTAQMLDNLAPDPADGLSATLALRCGGIASRGPADVVLGHATLRPGRLDGRELDAELLCNPPHDRRRPHGP